jgi:hypothetical protein
MAATATEGLRLRVLPRGRPVMLLIRGRIPGDTNCPLSIEVLFLLGARGYPRSALDLPASGIDHILSSAVPPPAFEGFLWKSCDLGDSRGASRGLEDIVRPRRRVSGDAPSSRFAEVPPRTGKVS